MLLQEGMKWLLHLILPTRVSQHSHIAVAAVTKDAMLFPVAISAAGIVICILCGFVATNVAPVKVEADIERVLKVGRFFLKVFLCTDIWLYLSITLRYCTSSSF